MRSKWVFFAGLVMILGMTGLALASNTANHTVTVTVDAINELAVSGGNVTLTINTAAAGANPDARQNATCGLQWTTNEAAKKITVVSDQAAPDFTLKALATGVTGGTATAEVTIDDNVAKDIVTGVATTIGSASVRYTASATAAQGTGTVTHTLTYTLTDV